MSLPAPTLFAVLVAITVAVAAFALLGPAKSKTAQHNRSGQKQVEKDVDGADFDLQALLMQAGIAMSPSQWHHKRLVRTVLFATAGALVGALMMMAVIGVSPLGALIGFVAVTLGGWAGWTSSTSALRSAAKKRAESAAAQLVELGAIMAQRIKANGTIPDAISSAITIGSPGVLRDELALVHSDYVHNQTPLQECLDRAQDRISDTSIHDLYRALAQSRELDTRVEEIVRRVSAARAGESEERIQTKTGPLTVKAGTLHIMAGTIILIGYPVMGTVLSALQGGF